VKLYLHAPICLHSVHKNNFTVTFTFNFTFAFLVTFNFTFTFSVTFTSTERQGKIVELLCRVRESRVEISDHGRAVLSHCLIVVSCPSVRLTVCIGTAPTGRISVKFDIADFSENLPTKSIFDFNSTKISGPLPEDLIKHILLFPATLNRHKSGCTAPNQQNPQACSLYIYITISH